jgi:hypothetical protein
MAGPAAKSYELKISRRTVDKLGVKLYDRVSAVVAELVANSYDADAESVTVNLPLATELARKSKDGEVEDKGFVVEVIDDGHGMSPDEAQDHYLKVGRDRREHREQGPKSRTKGRPVMGRKGIGKLAPFGVCRRIEIRSAGGPQTRDGYLVSHFFLDYAQINVDEETPVPLDAGADDHTFSSVPGTTVRLSMFLPKRVPDLDTFLRQLARRFGPTCEMKDFGIWVKDTRSNSAPVKVTKLDIPLMEDTRIEVSDRPVVLDEEPADEGHTAEKRTLPVSGFLAFSKDPFKTEETGGVAIYARGKIVAMTRDFGLPAGFTGEFATRSYLVGEIQADWLDAEEDLVRTDRQDILWDSELGRAFTAWGRSLLKEIARRGRAPRKQKVRDMFLERSRIKERARERFGDDDVVESAVELARGIGGFAAEDELADDDYVNELSEVILSVAPHRALIEAFRRISGSASVDDLLDLSGKTLVAELASYAQIALERVRAIEELEKVIRDESDERKLQELVSKWPWLIEPTWSVITANQALKTFRDRLQDWLKKHRSIEVTITVGQEAKRPDFTLVSIGRALRLVELKACGHSFDDTDWDRLVNYVDAMDDLFEKSADLRREFPEKWRIELVADEVKIRDSSKRLAYRSQESEKRLERRPWGDFLLRAKTANEEFLEAAEKVRLAQSRGGGH